MKFNIIGRKLTINDKNSEYVKRKIGKLDKFFKSEPEARIVLGSVKDKEYIEATIYYDGIIFRAEVIDTDIFTATDKALDIIERQIRKNKTKLEKRTKREAFSDSKLFSGEDYYEEENPEFNIVKRKRFQVKPMSAEEAVLQMNLLGHSFFVFKNQDTDELNVVYRRKDGNYAVIESTD
ncbi:MAG: ribosome-associated translation inhibitor RaiA [Clostridiales bacterium]|nr:ribosome-associated translation inhibitor RaiA [Clostridiales bacterium]